MKTHLLALSAVWLTTIPLTMAQDTEIQPYELIKKIDSVEIRYYPSATLVKTSGDNNFGKLFQYISGNNESKEKIAMTAPVYMNESKSEMAFVMPLSVHQKGAPIPKGEQVSLVVTEPRYVAAIQYGGYTNAKKEATHKLKLLQTLEENDISAIGEIAILGYDSPYKFYDRRNEIMVAISYTK